ARVGEQAVGFLVHRGLESIDAVIYMGVGGEQVLPAVVVEIEEAESPAAMPQGQRADAGFQGSVDEVAFAGIAKYRIGFTGERGNEDVRPAIVVVVLELGAHAGHRLSIVA